MDTGIDVGGQIWAPDCVGDIASCLVCAIKLVQLVDNSDRAWDPENSTGLGCF